MGEGLGRDTVRISDPNSPQLIPGTFHNIPCHAQQCEAVSFLRGCCSGAGSTAASWWKVIAFASLWVIWFGVAFLKNPFTYYPVFYLKA